MRAIKAALVLSTGALLLSGAACGRPRTLRVHVDGQVFELKVLEMVWLKDEQQVQESVQLHMAFSSDCCRTPEETELRADSGQLYLVILFELRPVNDQSGAAYGGVTCGLVTCIDGKLVEPDGATQYPLNSGPGITGGFPPGSRPLDAFVFHLRPGANSFTLWVGPDTLWVGPFEVSPRLIPMQLYARDIRSPEASGAP